jgi:hypothetical protein
VNGLTEVQRVGNTIRRATGPWTPAVHALLQHLEAVGFDAAPRVLGIDEQGRAVLTFVEGEETTWSDDELAVAGRLVRGYHDAVASFVPPPKASWQALVGTPAEHEVVCHNDLSPWNTVYRDGAPVTFLDWDLAAPGPRLWDVAWAIYRYVPLFDDDSCRRLGIPVQPRAPRVGIFCDAYGLGVPGGPAGATCGGTRAEVNGSRAELTSPRTRTSGRGRYDHRTPGGFVPRRATLRR